MNSGRPLHKMVNPDASISPPSSVQEDKGLNSYQSSRKLKIDELPGKEEIILHFALSPAVRASLLEALPAYDLPFRTSYKKI
jgi:hypothetical protein